MVHRGSIYGGSGGRKSSMVPKKPEFKKVSSFGFLILSLYFNFPHKTIPIVKALIAV